MIVLVLDDAGLEILEAELEALALPIVRAHLSSRRRGTRPRMSGMLRQPSQSSTISSPTGDDFRIDDGERLRRLASSRGLGLGGIERDDEQAHAFVHLRRRQTDAVVLGHRVHHVVDEPLNRRALDAAPLDGLRPCPQHRMPHARDFQDGHSRRIILRGSWPTGTCASHDETHAYRFCPRCGGELERRLLKATEPVRLVCPRCTFVFYLDPKIAVGTIIRTSDGRLVLVRRAIDPGYGKWVFPGGYVDRGEPLTTAAIREAREECGLDVRLDGLVNIYSYAGRAPVIVVYAATALGGTLAVRRGMPRRGAVRAGGDSVGRPRVPQHARGTARLPGRPAASRLPSASQGGAFRAAVRRLG